MAPLKTEVNLLEGDIKQGFTGKITCCESLFFRIEEDYSFSNRLISETLRKEGTIVCWTGKEFVSASDLETSR